jgi:hypothetical protein
MKVRIIRIILEDAWKKRVKSFFKRLPKVAVEICVNDRVEGGIKVSNPKENSDEDIRTGAMYWAAK